MRGRALGSFVTRKPAQPIVGLPTFGARPIATMRSTASTRHTNTKAREFRIIDAQGGANISRLYPRLIHSPSKQGALDPAQILPGSIFNSLRDNQFAVGQLDRNRLDFDAKVPDKRANDGGRRQSDIFQKRLDECAPELGSSDLRRRLVS